MAVAPMIVSIGLLGLVLVFALVMGVTHSTAEEETHPAIYVISAVVEDELALDPVHPVNDGLQLGFREAFGMNDSEIEAYRNTGLKWLKKRFGVDYLDVVQPVTDSSFDYYAIPGSTLVPVFYTANGNYRVQSSNSPVVPVHPHRRLPRIQEAEYVVTFNFTNPPTLTGTYAPGGELAQEGGSIRFGLYRILDEHDLELTRFEIRTYKPTRRQHEENADRIELVERMMARSEDLGTYGEGTFDVQYPVSGPPFRWHVRAYFSFSDAEPVWPEPSAWDETL